MGTTSAGWGTAAIAVGLLVLGGCAIDPASADEDPDDIVTGTVSNPLAQSAILWLNGTYVGCFNRSGAWSARVSGTATMDNPALTVVKNDPACVLTLTAMVADQTYTAAPAISLSTSYASSPSTFAAGATQLLANARLETGSFGSDFQITFVYGGDTAPTVASAAVSGEYTTVQSTTAATVVLPPTYTLDTSALRSQVNLVGLVYTMTGTAVLNDGTITGASYVIDMGTLGATPTYAQTGSAYTAAIATQKTITGANPVIAASEFAAGGVNLLGATQIRSVIVKRTSAGIAAYQIFRVSFVF